MRLALKSKSNGGLFSKEQVHDYTGELFHTLNARQMIMEMIKERHLSGKWVTGKESTLSSASRTLVTFTGTSLIEEIDDYYIVVPNTSHYHSLVAMAKENNHDKTQTTNKPTKNQTKEPAQHIWATPPKRDPGTRSKGKAPASSPHTLPTRRRRDGHPNPLPEGRVVKQQPQRG